MSNRNTADAASPETGARRTGDEPSTSETGARRTGDEPSTSETRPDEGSTTETPLSTDGPPTTETGTASEPNDAPTPVTSSGSEAEPGDLVVVCGLPGVGKTTVAKRIADHVGGEILRTDVIRKELFPDPTYADEETEAVYDTLIQRARERVVDGDAVVLDATFADERFRGDVRRMARDAADTFELVKVECDETTVKRRIEQRDGISDADFDIHLRFKELFDGVDSEHRVVDNSGGEASTFDQIDDVFD